jgi:hypothetical protein
VPAGTSLKVVEPPPGPPVIATLLAEVYGPDARGPARGRRPGSEGRVRKRALHRRRRRQLRHPGAAAAHDDLDRRAEFFHVEEQDVFDTIAILNGGRRSAIRTGRAAAIRSRSATGAAQGERVMDERFLTTPIPPTCFPAPRRGRTGRCGDGRRGKGQRSRSSATTAARRDGDGRTGRRFRGAALRHARRADALDAQDWTGEKPEIILHGQPEDESKATTLLWDGEWEVTWVTFRDMGAAFGVALLGIYILVVAQFGSFKLPLVILTPIPLTFIGIMVGTGCSARRSRRPR